MLVKMFFKLLIFWPSQILMSILGFWGTYVLVVSSVLSWLVFAKKAQKQALLKFLNTCKQGIIAYGKHLKEIGLKGVSALLVALVSLTLGNLVFRLIYSIPLVNHARKRFKKEAMPILRFKTWRSWLVMGLVGSVGAVMLTNYLVCLLRGTIPLVYSLGKVPFD